MFRTILFPCYQGQKLTANLSSPQILSNYLNLKYRVDLELSPNLFQNLKNLYQINKHILVPKINIGGDHSMSIATVAHSIQTYPRVKVIWFDAHPDINTYQSSTSKNYHGMPLAFLTGLDYEEKFNFLEQKLPFVDLLYVGIRDIDSYESEIIKSKKIKYITCSELNQKPLETLHKIKQFISDLPCHISFDVDSLDPGIIDSTGTPVPEGLQLGPCRVVLDGLHREHIVNMDITELNLKLGESEKSLKNLKYLFQKYLQYPSFL